MVQGQPAVGVDGTRSHPRWDHRVRCARSQPQPGSHHVHRVPWRRPHAHAQDAHPAPHRVQFDRRYDSFSVLC